MSKDTRAKRNITRDDKARIASDPHIINLQRRLASDKTVFDTEFRVVQI